MDYLLTDSRVVVQIENTHLIRKVGESRLIYEPINEFALFNPLVTNQLGKLSQGALVEIGKP